MTEHNLPVPDDAPWLNLSKEEVEKLRQSKKGLTNYGREKLQELMKNQEPYPDYMFEEAAKRERANELYQDALQELDNLAAGVDSEDFMNAYLVIQTALKVALGEEDV
jgi:hypothetical protein